MKNCDCIKGRVWYRDAELGVDRIEPCPRCAPYRPNRRVEKCGQCGKPVLAMLPDPPLSVA